MTLDFKDKNVLITGGSRGIGRAAAQLFAEFGANVIITYKTNKEAAGQTLASLQPAKHSAYQLDVSDPLAIQNFFSEFAGQYGRLDVLVNNAAVYPEHKITECSYDEWQQSWDETLKANLTGPANMCYFASRQMIKQNEGRIINVSSRGAFRGEPDHPAYGASKAGLNPNSAKLPRL